jgi:DNA invertase Pin-like site-specific DNA recombinase/transposase
MRSPVKGNHTPSGNLEVGKPTVGDPAGQSVRRFEGGSSTTSFRDDLINVLIKIAYYARFSSAKQKQSSIDRQIVRCAGYSATNLGTTDHRAFVDEGKSAATISERPALLRLIAAVERGEITDVVIEDFDRLSREVYDAVDLGKLFEKHDVKLHMVSLGRVISKMELIDHAKHAEMDRLRRADLTSSGVDQLVQSGGMPNFPFGYKDGLVPGFPDICPVAGPAVQRMFELLSTLSDNKTAMALTKEGFIAPDGTTHWQRGMIPALRRNEKYIGIVRHRMTNQTKGKDGKRSRVVKRPEDEWVTGFNEKYRLVDEDVFYAIRDRNLAKSVWREGRIKDASPRRYILGHPVCDCPGAEPGQHFRNGSGQLHCMGGGKFQRCLRPYGQDVPFSDLEKAGMRLLLETVAPVLSGDKLGAYLRDSICSRVAKIDARRADLARSIESENRKIDRLLSLAEDGQRSAGDRLGARVHDLETLIATLRSSLQSSIKIDVAQIDFAASAANLQDALALVQDRVPYIVKEPRDEIVFGLFQRLVKQVVIERQDLPIGRVTIVLHLALDEIYLSAEQAAALDVETVVVRTEISVPTRFLAGRGSREKLEALASSGVYELTDAQWNLVGHLLPDMMLHRVSSKSLMPTRQVANALLFKMRTGVGTFSVPDCLGNPRMLGDAMDRMVYLGGADTLLKILVEAEPGLAEGLSLRGFHTRRHRAPVVTPPAVIAQRMAESGSNRLTDDQWEAISAAIDPAYVRGISRPRRTPLRTTIEGIFIKLRARCTFASLPNEYGGLEMTNVSIWLARTGTWRNIVAICEARYPQLLDGVDFDYMLRTERGARASAEKGRSLYKAHAQNGIQVVKNLRGIAEAASASTGYLVFRAPVGLRMSDAASLRLIRPDIVIGRVPPAAKTTYRSPVAVIEKVAMWGASTDESRTAAFRQIRGLNHIVQVHQDKLKVEHHRRSGNRWTKIIVETLEDEVAIPEMRLVLRLAEIYRRTTFGACATS